jgi:recombination protein RecR
MANGLPQAVEALVVELRKLPGVGEKTATRYVLHLLNRGPASANALRHALDEVVEKVRECSRCGFLADGDLCAYCGDQDRDRSVVCVVEGIADLMAFERIGEYRGSYHVLGGALSALRGMTADRIRIRELLERVASGEIREVIVATGADAEGETTALYIRKLLEGKGVRVTRPATGIPMGSAIEFLDAVTLMRALRARKDL